MNATILGEAFLHPWREIASALRSCEDYARHRGFIEVEVEGNDWHGRWFPSKYKALAALGPDVVLEPNDRGGWHIINVAK